LLEKLRVSQPVQEIYCDLVPEISLLFSQVSASTIHRARWIRSTVSRSIYL